MIEYLECFLKTMMHTFKAPRSKQSCPLPPNGVINEKKTEIIHVYETFLFVFVDHSHF